MPRPSTRRSAASSPSGSSTPQPSMTWTVPSRTRPRRLPSMPMDPSAWRRPRPPAGPRLIHVSTDYVFDGQKGSPYDENDKPNPLSVYARSKREGERRVLASGAPACVLRTAWLYGRYGKNFVKAIQAAAARGGPLKVVADQVGSPTSTADLAAAIARL